MRNLSLLKCRFILSCQLLVSTTVSPPLSFPYDYANGLLPADFFVEIVGSIKYYIDRLRNRQSTSRPRGTFTDNEGQTHTKANFEEAFGFGGGYTTASVEGSRRTQMRGSYDENIRLAPYAYGGNGRRRAPSADDVVSARSASQSQEEGYYGTPDLGGKLQPVQSRQLGMPPPV